VRLAAAVLAVGLTVSGCALWRVAPGPTKEGLIVAVQAKDSAAGRREAVEAVLPLFLTPAARDAKSAALEKDVLSKPGRFIGRERRPRNRPRLEEVRLGLLSGALDRAGLIRPEGYAAGPAKVLLVMSESDRALGVGLAADSLRRALSARGLEAQNARDPLNRYPFKAKTVPDALAAARAEGADWLMLGAARAAAAPDPYSGAWKGQARVWADLYALSGSTEPVAVSADATAVDVSSPAALGRALSQAGENAATRTAELAAKRRGGRAELAVLVSGTRDPSRLRAILEELRSIDGVSGAALGAWNAREGAVGLRVFAAGLKADELAARLVRRDPSVLLGGVDPEDGEINLIETSAGGIPGIWN
jgi:hypothetical protein